MRTERRSDPAAKARAEELERRALFVLSRCVPPQLSAHQRRQVVRALLKASVALAARECGAEQAASLCGQLAGRTWGPVRRGPPPRTFGFGGADT